MDPTGTAGFADIVGAGFCMRQFRVAWITVRPGSARRGSKHRMQLNNTSLAAPLHGCSSRLAVHRLALVLVVSGEAGVVFLVTIESTRPY